VSSVIPPFPPALAPLEAQVQLPAARHSLRQDWVLNPVQDWLLIIAAPVLVVAAALLLFRLFDAAQATTLILTVHVVFTVAHHLPTFIRVYGDVELLRRYRWRFVLAPALPVAFSVSLLLFLNTHQYPLEYFLYAYIFLALWDPWHFLRQHYGFMRIYDRANTAPRVLAARMDWWLCATWFVFIMLASGAWLAGILEDLNATAPIPALLMLPLQWLPRLTDGLGTMAVLVSVAYAVYTAWCWRNGYFISVAKLALCAATFGAMYFAYAPNPWMLSLAPAWSFKVGFAAIGLVHMTQYLAVVWRYNRRLAAQPGRARSGWFARLHARGGWLTVAAYVAVCIAYGEVITTPQTNDWIMSALLAVGFTSTLLHYYFDGFIWKVRHRQNQENLGSSDRPPAAEAISWWSTRQRDSAAHTVARQLLYIALPLLVLTFGAVAVWSDPPANYVAQMHRAQGLSQQGAAAAAAAEAQVAYESMQARLPVLTQLALLDPSPTREAELAYLIYNQSHYQHIVLPALAGQSTDATVHRANIARAVGLLERALHDAGLRQQPLAHPGREQLSRADAEYTLDAWRLKLSSPSQAEPST